MEAAYLATRKEASRGSLLETCLVMQRVTFCALIERNPRTIQTIQVHQPSTRANVDFD